MQEDAKPGLNGNDESIGDMIRILSKRKSPSPILSGPAGAGASTMFSQLADKIAAAGEQPLPRNMTAPRTTVLGKGFMGGAGPIGLKKPAFLNTPEQNAAIAAAEEEKARRAVQEFAEAEASVCHSGIAQDLSPMKPLRLRRGMIAFN